MHAVDRLYKEIEKKKTPLIIGLDPNLKEFPKHLLDEIAKDFELKNHEERGFEAAAEAIRRFNFSIIDSTSDLVTMYKLQAAYYEQYGHWGFRAMEDTIAYIKSKKCLVCLDAKRNDIGSTSQAYAEAHMGKVLLPDGKMAGSLHDVDFMTVNGYLGSDGILPFVEVADREDKGIFVLVKTSNKSSGELQDINAEGEAVYVHMAKLISRMGKIGKCGFSNVGAVVGATYPEEAAKLREMLPNTLFLMPGYGAQGAMVLANGFKNGKGAIINSSRGIIYAGKNEDFAEEARKAAMKAIKEIKEAFI